jgi:glyoxylase-like metal-dependent hydrolase (beta-lactamase superfamily II)
MNSITFGAYTLYSMQTGLFRLDGGAMFGVVPKTLWSKSIPADENNRILMGMRSLLVKSHDTGRLYMIDTGIGHKFDARFQEIYQVDFTKGSIQSELESAGFDVGDITDVILTHLHFDHCGGTTRWSPDKSTSELVFPNANIWVNRAHWNNATRPNMREKASFLRENLEPLGRHPRLLMPDGAHVFEDNFYTMIVNGHTTGQQLPVIQDGDRKLVFAADLFPTHAHIPVSWVMGYDMFPLTTMEESERILARASAENWYFFLEHDADHEIIQVHHDGRNYKMSQSLSLSDLQ